MTTCRLRRLHLLLLLAPLQLAYPRPTYLIVAHPDQLIVYNKYQQIATREEIRGLEPFGPIPVLDEDGLLADGFSPCMTVLVGGERMYIAKLEDGTLKNLDRLGFTGMYRDVEMLDDTVSVLIDNTIRLSPIGSEPAWLEKEKTILRIFRSKGKTYCRVDAEPPTFGWVSWSSSREGRDWKRNESVPLPLGAIGSELRQRIDGRVNELNILLSRLFTFLNGRSDQKQETPRWEVSGSAHTIDCVLRGTSTRESFEESTFYLATEIENLLLGGRYRVVHSPGLIKVVPGVQ